MACLDEEKIIRYLNGLLDCPEMEKANGHLSSCRACAKAVELERGFDLLLSRNLKEDLEESVASGPLKASLEKARGKNPYRMAAVIALLMWGLAVFNSFAILFLCLYLNEFSFANMVGNSHRLLSYLFTAGSIYVTWINAVSVTLAAALGIISAVLLGLRGMVLRTVRI